MGKKFGLKRKEWMIQDGERIKEVYKKGVAFEGDYTYIYYLEDEEKKFSIRVEKGVKGGVRRNKLRRWLREIVRQANPLLKNGHYIIEGKKRALESTYNEIKEDFEKICLRGNLWLR
ncbi:MAG: ribonuclease P protein component [candidate division WOR-3 bacterium]